MIVDTHVHVWSLDTERYPWSPIGGYIPQVEAPVEALLKHMETNQVDHAVLVQPTPYGWDNSHLLDTIRSFPAALKAVCLVDPFDPNNSYTMEKLVKERSASGFRLNWNLAPPAEWEDVPAHLAFWRTASALDVPICIQCTMEYLPLLVKMAASFPELSVVIDHLARVEVSENIPPHSFDDLLAVSNYANIYMKLSGFYYCSKAPPPYTDLQSLIGRVISAIGAKRCTWGSDFPFILEKWNYAAFLRYLTTDLDLSDEERAWLLGKTAMELWW